MKMRCRSSFVVKDNIVVCRVTPIEEEDSMLRKLMNIVGFYYNENFSKRIINPFIQSYKGVAILKDGDINNIELAKKIARKKAVRQMFKCYKNSLKNCYDQIINISTEIETSRNSVLRKVDKITDEIKELNLT